MTDQYSGQSPAGQGGVPEPLSETFTVSRLYRLRRAVRKRPYYSLIYFGSLVLFWTVAMSYGAALHGSNPFAVQYTPFIALYSIILGILVYPVRLFWLPTLAAGSIFVLPMLLPFVANERWQAAFQAAPQVFLYFLFCNIVIGAFIGLSISALRFSPKRFSPYGADLARIIASVVIFLIVCLAFAYSTKSVFADLAPQTLDLLGMDENYIELATRRIFRGGAVMLAFFLIVLQRPKRSDVRYIIFALAVYSGLAVFHSFGVGGFPALDASVIALILAVVLPSSIGTLALAIGVAVYASITGTYLRDIVYDNPAEGLLDSYSIAILMVGTVVLAMRSFFETREEEHVFNISRLDSARDFANVGIFAANLYSGRVRLDVTGMRIMGVDSSLWSLEKILKKLPEEDRDAIMNLGLMQPGTNANLNIRVLRTPDDVRDLTVYVWSEQANSGLMMAYGLVLDVTSQKAQANELSRTLTTLQEKDERQSRMFSIISHELRTPASVISLLTDDLTPANAPEVQSQLREASEHLLGVLADMRQAVNPDQDMTVQIGPYAPATIAQSVRNTLHHLAEDKGMTITMSLSAGAEQQRLGDQLRVKQLLGNLVKNAIVHSGGTIVDIAFEEQIIGGKRNSVWTVSDNGTGIPDQDVDRLFEPFERGGNDPKSRPDGSGLGLFIAKLAVDALSGTIKYINQPVGAAYRFSIPEDLAPLRQPERRLIATKPDASCAELTVLLVEDHLLMAQVTKKQLEKHFKRVELAENGRVALDMMRKDLPDLVITDLFMPEMEGDVLIRTMAEDGISVPTIGLTAASVGNDMDRFHEAGAKMVLQKPLNMDLVLEFAGRIEPRGQKTKPQTV